MKHRPWLVLLLLACIAWGLDAYWWWHMRGSWRPPAAIQPALPPPPRLPAAGNAGIASQALERPLFWSDRRPVAAATGGAGSDGADRELRQARLVAVLESGPDRIALLQRADGSPLKITAATSGQRWRLDRFDGRVARFVGVGGQSLDLVLERVEETTPPAAPAAASARRQPTATTGRQSVPADPPVVPELGSRSPAARSTAGKPENR